MVIIRAWIKATGLLFGSWRCFTSHPKSKKKSNCPYSRSYGNLVFFLQKIAHSCKLSQYLSMMHFTVSIIPKYKTDKEKRVYVRTLQIHLHLYRIKSILLLWCWRPLLLSRGIMLEASSMQSQVYSVLFGYSNSSAPSCFSSTNFNFLSTLISLCCCPYFIKLS